MGAAKILPYYTITDWEWWEGQWELIEGMPFAMSPAPLPKHQRVSGNLYQQFNIRLKKCKPCKVYLAIDWIIANDTILQPDVLVVCGEIKHRLDFVPELVVEILSKATVLKDRNSKFHIYEEQKVKYYIILDPETDAAEVYEYNGNQYQLKAQSNEYNFKFSQDCDVTIDFTEIWD